MDLLVLPDQVRNAFFRLSEQKKREATELRFRKGRPVTVVFPQGEELLIGGGGGIPVTDRLLEEVLNRATGFSPYSLKLEETGLYLPLEGGCRMGLCGEVVIRDGKLSGIRYLTSLSIRLARECIGIARETADRLCQGTSVDSALIISPPGRGKTTFLRDLIRCISQKGFRVCVVDERRELSAMTRGEISLDLGPTTDVLCGCPKVQSIELLIRAMNPQVLALDEISGEAELEAALYASFSGVCLLATAHGDGVDSLMKKPLYKKLLESGAFDWCITLDSCRKPMMERLGTHAETDGCFVCDGGFADGRLGRRAGVEPETAAFATASSFSGVNAGGTGAEYAAAFTAF